MAHTDDGLIYNVSRYHLDIVLRASANFTEVLKSPSHDGIHSAKDIIRIDLDLHGKLQRRHEDKLTTDI